MRCAGGAASRAAGRPRCRRQRRVRSRVDEIQHLLDRHRHVVASCCADEIRDAEGHRRGGGRSCFDHREALAAESAAEGGDGHVGPHDVVGVVPPLADARRDRVISRECIGAPSIEVGVKATDGKQGSAATAREPIRLTARGRVILALEQGGGAAGIMCIIRTSGSRGPPSPRRPSPRAARSAPGPRGRSTARRRRPPWASGRDTQTRRPSSRPSRRRAWWRGRRSGSPTGRRGPASSSRRRRRRRRPAAPRCGSAGGRGRSPRGGSPRWAPASRRGCRSGRG